MKNHGRQILWVAALVAAWITTGWAQQASAPKQEGQVKIEGAVTKVLTSQMPPALEIKTTEGKTYVIHLGPIPSLTRQGFKPKVGDTIAVSGEFCCVVDGKQAVRSKEITLGAKTFTTPGGPPQAGANRQNSKPGAACCGSNAADCCAHGEHGEGMCPHCPMQE